MAVHLKPDGASYTGTWENFVAPRSLKSRAGKTPLNLTDVIVGPDGALYFITGGRRTQSDLLRVTYRGTNAAAPLAAAQLQEENGRAARELRRSLESWNARPDSAAAWIRSVCRQRNAGICKISIHSAATAQSSGECTSVVTGTPSSRPISPSNRQPARAPMPRNDFPDVRFALS